MMSMDSFGQLDDDFIEKTNETGMGMLAFQFLMGAYLQFIIMLAICGVMVLLAIAFVWRIVVLWILIIMSPMAFFLGGIKDVFGAAGKSYEEWWSKFTSALTFGPVMCFFLWLSLAASAGSNLATTEDFPMPNSENSTDLPMETFSLDNFLGMFIALAILIAGMQQASSSAAALGGFASKMLSEDMGKGLVKGLARSPFAAAGGFKKERAWANDKAKKGAMAASQFAPDLTKGVGNALAKGGTKLSGVRGLGGLGNAMAAVGGNVVKGAKETQKENAKLGGEQFKERTKAQIAALDLSNANGTNAYDSLPVAEKNAQMKSFGTDLKRRDEFKENLKKSGMSDADIKTKHDEMFKKSKKFLDSDEGKAVMDDTEKDRWQDSKFANMHLLDSDAEREKVWKAQEKEGRLNLGLMSKDALSAPDRPAAGTTPALSSTASFLRNQVSRRDDKGKDVKAFDDIVSHGKGTPEQRDALIGTIAAPDVSRVSTPDERKTSAQNVAALVTSGRIPKMDATQKPLMDAMRGNLGSLGSDLSPENQGKASAQLIESGQYGGVSDAARDILGAPDATTGAWTPISAGTDPSGDALDRIDNLVGADASNAALLDQWIPAESAIATDVSGPVTANEVTKRVANASKADIDALYKNEPGATPQTVARKKQALSSINRSVSAQLHAEDQKSHASEQLRKTKEAVAAAQAELTAAEASHASADTENTAATAAVAAKSTVPASQWAAIDARAASATTALASKDTARIAARTKRDDAVIVTAAADARSTALGKENKVEMKRLEDLHARIKNTGTTTSRYSRT